jgi:hypothetical protein
LNKRTWDLMAKYVSEEHGIKVVLDDSVPGPCINMESKTIMLPEKIKDENALSALSSLIHEAAHMKYTAKVPTKEIVKTSIDMHILNVIEDIRIDNKNFYLLPNVYLFYEEFVKNHLCAKENMENIDKQSLFTRCMITLILQQTNFGHYCWDKEAMQYINDNDLSSDVRWGVNYIENSHWDEVIKVIAKIKSKFNIPAGEDKPNESKSNNGTNGEGGNRKGGVGSGDKADDCSGTGLPDGTVGDSKGTGKGEISNPEKYLRPASVWSKGKGLEGPGGKEFSKVELQEMTKSKFRDVMNIKEKRSVEDGCQLDTGNLIAFFTGDIHELFHEIREEKVKRSKIVFCLDASGSMSAKLIDKKTRRVTLARCVESLIEIIVEVCEVEGLNVDYDVIGFSSRSAVLNKETWRAEYMRMNGGTNLSGAIQSAVDLLNKDEIDGNKIIVGITDGEVSLFGLDRVKEILQENNEIKAMLLGIGADQQKEMFVHNILCGDNADEIIMESIQTMLEG